MTNQSNLVVGKNGKLVVMLTCFINPLERILSQLQPHTDSNSQFCYKLKAFQSRRYFEISVLRE